MTSQFAYDKLSNADDEQQLGKIIQQCFNSPPDNLKAYFERIGRENFRSIRNSNQIIGGLALIPQGQWFGGECIPMGGIAAVGIAPEYRGLGAALLLMQHTIKELYRRGIPISTLYAATQRLYRQAGYEQGGSFCGWEIPTQSIMVRSTLPMQAVEPTLDAFQDLYLQQAKVTNGYLQRHPAIWQEILATPTYAYLIGKPSQPEGYLIFKQQEINHSNCIVIQDLVLLSTDAVRRFWTFIADHRSQIEKVRWRNSPNEALTLMLSEQTARIYDLGRWMVRIVDVIKALEKRGYPQRVTTELHLDISDDLIVENNGKFILSVARGRGEVTKGGRGELKLGVKGLSPLYTGLLTPHQLQLAGWLEGSHAALVSATEIFSEMSPWMIDFF